MSNEQDLIAYATGLREALEPKLTELPEDPSIRLASIIVAAALIIPADGKTFEAAVAAARKVLTDYAAAGRKLGPPPTQH